MEAFAFARAILRSVYSTERCTYPTKTGIVAYGYDTGRSRVYFEWVLHGLGIDFDRNLCRTFT